MKATVDRLMNIKRSREKLLQGRQEAEGVLKSARERLKKEHDCSNVEEAQKLAASLASNIEEAESALQTGLDELEEMYDW
jgi:hypothetical protein